MKMTRWYKNQIEANNGKVPPHLVNATQFTKYGEIDYTNHMANHKPFRKAAWLARQEG